jgi:FMN reductase
MRPFIVGIGGTPRQGSSTERALSVALRAAEGLGADTKLFDGVFLAKLPHFHPIAGEAPTAEQQELVEAVRRADGVVIASPGYHGSISGLLKNGLDTLELLRTDERPYLHDRAVGVIVTADGWQAAGVTLGAVRAIIHALRGWPTPFGAALNSRGLVFDADGNPGDEKDARQLATVGEQVMQFANRRGAT